jgi:cellulose biosynthesis protein BcsQ
MITRLINQVRQSGANPDLQLEGIVMTMYDARTNLAQQVVSEVRKHFGDKVYDTMIARNIRISEAPSHGLPVVMYDGKSSGAEAYRQLAKEFIKKRKAATPPPAPVAAPSPADPPSANPVRMTEPLAASTPIPVEGVSVVPPG